MKLWEGRFTEPSAKNADDFNQSLSFDYKLYWHDILASIAHVKMLGETQIIPKENAEKISDALVNILADIEKGSLQIEGAEDIHTFIENELVKRIGAVGKTKLGEVLAQVRVSAHARDAHDLVRTRHGQRKLRCRHVLPPRSYPARTYHK